jgi:hypothetical protein
MEFEKLQSLFEIIKTEWREDSKVDFQFKNKEYTEDLGNLALNIPYLHNKYLNHYSDLSEQKMSLEMKLRYVLKKKREYYSGEADAKDYAEKPFGASIKTAEKMKTYLEADEDIITLEGTIKYIEVIMNYLDNVMKQITNRGFQIKSAIDWEKFVNGVS